MLPLWTLPLGHFQVLQSVLTKFKQDITNMETYKQSYLQLITEYSIFVRKNWSQTVQKTEAGATAAAVSTKRPWKTFTCSLPDDS